MSVTLASQLQNFFVQSFAFFLIGLAVYLASRALKMRTLGWVYGDAKRSAIWGLVAYLIAAIVLPMMVFSATRSATSSGPVQIRYDSSRFVNQAISYLILAGPALIIMFVRKEPWESSGVTRRNLLGSCFIGLGIGAVSIFTSDALEGMGRGLNGTHWWALLYYAVVGFGEEFLFRGYLQTRLVGWLGQILGWALASVLMAMMHLSQRIIFQGLSWPEALVSSALLIPISLLMGYVMLRTSNIVAPGIAHTFANWVGVFGSPGLV